MKETAALQQADQSELRGEEFLLHYINLLAGLTGYFAHSHFIFNTK